MNPITTQVEKIQFLLRERRVEDARRTCDRLLRKNPHDLNLAITLIRTIYAGGAYNIALDICDRVLAKQRRFAPALFYRGLALMELGKSESALQAFQQGLAYQPDSMDFLVQKGLALDSLNRSTEAISVYEHAITTNPGCIEALTNLGNALQKVKRDEEAVVRYTQALTINPAYLVALYNRGLALNRLWRFQEALNDFDKVLAVQPDFAPALNDRSLALTYLGRMETALESCDKAIQLVPGFGQALANRGVILNHLGRFESALHAFEAAQSTLGETSETLNGRALALRGLGRLQAALACHECAIHLHPESLQSFIDRGVTLAAMERVSEASESYNQALRIDPNCPDPLFNKGLLELGEGNFVSGWQGYEYRWRLRGVETRKFESIPVWNGQPLAKHQSLFVWGEQGVGDEVLFASIYPELADLGERCAIECRAKLAPLFRRSFPWARIVLREEGPTPEFLSSITYHIAATSLGMYYRRSLEDFPKHNGYLLADPGRIAYWRSRLDGLGSGLKVGFSWRSSNLKAQSALSSTTLGEWGALFNIPGVRWICLQYDDCMAELDDASKRFGVPLHRFPDIDYYDNLDEVGALMKALDLVITTPTSVSRQSAAIGVPTWQISYGREWQTHGTEGVPWYPALQRFSRRWDESWQIVFDRIAVELGAKIV